MSDDEVARRAFEEAATIMVVLTADGTIRRINDRGCQVLGYDRTELVGRDWFETVVPADSEIGLAAVLEAVRDTDEFDVHENTVRTRDGEVRYIKWHVSGLRDETGAVTELLVSGSDVTDRVETERRLRQYEAAVESSTNLLAAVDRDYTYVLTNRRYRDLYGVDGRPVEGQTVADVLGDEQFAALKSHLDRALDGELIEYESEREGPDGDYRVFHVRYFPLEAEDGTIQGAVAALRDVTERREREHERQAARDTFEGLFDGINDAVFVHNFDAEFLAVNETACERLGYDEDTLLELSPRDIDAPEQADEVDERIATIREAGELTFETVHATKDGREIPVEITASLVTYFGEPAILSVARDISERKQRERQLRREVDRLAEFASVISHDLRNPLNVAQGRLTLVADECDVEHEHIGPIETALERMEAIIDDTLTLARQGESVGETEPVAIEDVLEASWNAVATEGATVSLVEPFTIRADRDRLQHVFENLFGNAVEHGSTSPEANVGPAGEITIRVGPLEDGFFIEDDGHGIDPDNCDRVFEPGFSTREDGTGFGLAIVRQIAEAHGWSVAAVESDTGGARFVFDGVEIVR